MPAALPSRSTAPAARQSEPALFDRCSSSTAGTPAGRTAASASSFGGACWRCIVGELQGCAFVEQHLQVFELIEPRRGCTLSSEALPTTTPILLPRAGNPATLSTGAADHLQLRPRRDITGLADQYQPGRGPLSPRRHHGAHALSGRRRECGCWRSSSQQHTGRATSPSHMQTTSPSQVHHPDSPDPEVVLRPALITALRTKEPLELAMTWAEM